MNEEDKLVRRNSGLFIEFEGITMELLPQKALWIKDLNTLLIADLHFGKAAHFRKSGIPIPEPIHALDLNRLGQLHQELRPKHTFFLGDLFHSVWNDQWGVLDRFLGQYQGTTFHLIRGNHDILSAGIYAQSIFEIHEEPFPWGNFLLSHEPIENVPENQLNVCGHIHPGIFLRGKARQSVRVPCFFKSKNLLILPSFGNFTGLALVNPKEKDQIWAIAGEKVIPVLSGTSIG
jgi:uncharacterized protein